MRFHVHVTYSTIIMISMNEAARVPIYMMNHKGRQVCNFSLRRSTTAALFCDNLKRSYVNSNRTPVRHPQQSLIPTINTRNPTMYLIHPWGSHSSHHIHTELLSLGNSHDESNFSDLTAKVKEAYASAETDGVQAALKSNNIISKLSTSLNSEKVASILIDTAIEAAGKDKGGLAAILNSVLASCCGTEGSTANSQISLAILNGMDKMNAMDETSMVAPDLVSLSLVYYALHQKSKQNEGKEFDNVSQTILERAQKLAKKAAGSQRRKELNMERRRGTNSNEIDSKHKENILQSLYGPDIRILYETSDVIVISKPAGMVCYHSKRTGAGKITSSWKKNIRAANEKDADKGAKRMDISVVDALIDSSVSLSTLNPSARGIVHRLDRGTSGALILAKTDESHLILTALFFLRRVDKKYLALVAGRKSTNHDSCSTEERKQINDTLSLGSTGVIDAPVDGRPARSTYRVLKEYGKENHLTLPYALLLEVTTLTGRKHQVRVHCASLGHPILLDPLYSTSNFDHKSSPETKQKKRRSLSPTLSNEMENTVLGKAFSDLLRDNNNSQQQQQERFFLHAAALSVDELDISVYVPLPQWWLDFMEQGKLK